MRPVVWPADEPNSPDGFGVQEIQARCSAAKIKLASIVGLQRLLLTSRDTLKNIERKPCLRLSREIVWAADRPLQGPRHNWRVTWPLQEESDVRWPVGSYCKVGAIRYSRIVVCAQVIGTRTYATKECETILVCLFDNPISAAQVATDLHSKTFNRMAMVLDSHSKGRPNLKPRIEDRTGSAARDNSNRCKNQFC